MEGAPRSLGNDVESVAASCFADLSWARYNLQSVTVSEVEPRLRRWYRLLQHFNA